MPCFRPAAAADAAPAAYGGRLRSSHTSGRRSPDVTALHPGALTLCGLSFAATLVHPPCPQATVDKALHLVDLYVQRGIDPDRLYIKVGGWSS